MSTTGKPAPLGRGLSALFGDADTSYQAPSQTSGATAEKKAPPQVLPITWLQPGAFQPRQNFDEDAISNLADSIRERGILQPILVRPLANTKDLYEIIAGERRWRAAQKAGLHQVPVVIRALSDREALEFGIIENVQRQDLSALEEAEGYRRLMEEFDHTQEDLSKIIGKSRSHIANLLRLLTLPDAIKQMIESGKLSPGHARALLTVKDPLVLAEEIIKNNLSVRQAEELAKRVTENPYSQTKKPDRDVNNMALEKDLERATGLKIKIDHKGKAGTVTVHYHDLAQFNDIVKKLRGY